MLLTCYVPTHNHACFAMVVCSGFKIQSYCNEPMDVLDFLGISCLLFLSCFVFSITCNEMILTEQLIHIMLKFHYLLVIYELEWCLQMINSRHAQVSFYLVIMKLYIVIHELERFLQMINSKPQGPFLSTCCESMHTHPWVGIFPLRNNYLALLIWSW